MSNIKKQKIRKDEKEKIEESSDVPDTIDENKKKEKFLNRKQRRVEIASIKVIKDINKFGNHSNSIRKKNKKLEEDEDENINFIELDESFIEDNSYSNKFSSENVENDLNKEENDNINKILIGNNKKIPGLVTSFPTVPLGFSNYRPSNVSFFHNSNFNEMDNTLTSNKFIYSRGKQNEFIKRALESLKSDDEIIVLNALCELTSDLSLASDSVADDVNCQVLIKELILLFDKFYTLPDISMSALQCLNYILDLNPRYTSNIIKYNGVSKIVKLTQNIEYIDCAENAIKAIEKMSFENPYAMLESDAFQSILILIDFFDLNLRKSALKSCVNMTKALSNIEYIKKFLTPAVPSLTNLTKYSGNSDLEKNILDLAIQCFYNIAYYLKLYNLSSNYNFCNSLIQYGLLENIFELFVKFLGEGEDNKYSNVIQADTFKNILRLFEILCSISPDVTNLVLNMNILEIIYSILSKELGNGISGSSSNKKLSSSSSSCYTELFALLISFFPDKKSKYPDRLLSANNQHFFIYFSDKILTHLINNVVNIPSSNTMVSLMKLLAMYIQNSPYDYIQKYIDPVKLSNIASKMVDSKDASYVGEVFNVVEIIMNKVPELFFVSFLREGVVDHIKNLIEVQENQLYITQDKYGNSIYNKEKYTLSGSAIQDLLLEEDSYDFDEFDNYKERLNNVTKCEDLKFLAKEDVDAKNETFDSLSSNINNNPNNISNNPSNVLGNFIKEKMIHKMNISNPNHYKKVENNEETSIPLTNDRNIKNSNSISKKTPFASGSTTITKSIQLKSREISEKYFKDECINNLLLKTGSLVNPKEILQKLNYIKEVLKNPNEVNLSILVQLFDILFDKNKITFYEIESSQIILYLTKYLDENFMINYDKTYELENRSFVHVSGRHNRNISKNLKILFLALNNNLEKISEFIKILQYCISSMNCFKLFLYDIGSVKNASHLFLSSFKNPSQKIKIKFLYSPSDLSIKNLLNDEKSCYQDLYDYLVKKKNISMIIDQYDTFDHIKESLFKIGNKSESTNLNKVSSSSIKDDYYEEIFAQIRDRKGSEEDMQLTEKLLQRLIERKKSMEGNDQMLNSNCQNTNQINTSTQNTSDDNLKEFNDKLDVSFYILINGNRMDIDKDWSVSDLLREMRSFFKKADYLSISTDLNINFDVVYKSNYDENEHSFNEYSVLINENDEEEICLSIEKNDKTIQEGNYEYLLFEKFYRDNIVNNKSLYSIKRVSPFVYLIALLELGVNNFASLFELNRGIILSSDLENLKMTSLLFKQVKDPYAVSSSNIPSWCKEMSQSFTYLSGFNSRYLLFKISSFDTKRSMSNLYVYLKNYMGENILEDKTLSQQKRQKIKINRNEILIDSERIMKEFKGYNGYLEFEYFDETGTGIGPTNEFFSLALKELKKLNKLWYKTTDFSLYPTPVDPSNLNQIEENKKLFTLMGFIIARGLYDDRLLDFPLNSLFWDIALDRPISFEKINRIDKDLGKAVLDFISIINQKLKIKNNRIGNEIINLNDLIKYNNTKIEDIGLTFTLPGYDIELKRGGLNELLNIYNLEEYLTLIFDKLILTGIREFIEAFKLGFNYVFPISSLKCFTSQELEEIICGCPSDSWELDVLFENIIPSHGFDKNSIIFKGLIEIMSTMDKVEKKKFLLFVTASPRLPLGGFKNLNPKLMVVKKKPEIGHENPDDYLPTVMTCQNFLKIPEYSNIVVLKEKLLLAMNEGGNAFHLS